MDRLLAFGMVLLMITVMTATLLLSTVLARANRLVGIELRFVPLWNILLSLALFTLIFASIFKVLPRVKLAWRDVWMGAFVTAALFVIGQELIGLYLALSNVTSAYGTAGSIVVLLIFIFFTAQILLLGAEFTKHYARRLGSRPEIDDYAVRYRIVTEKDAEES